MKDINRVRDCFTSVYKCCCCGFKDGMFTSLNDSVNTITKSSSAIYSTCYSKEINTSIDSDSKVQTAIRKIRNL